ncbi:MAG: hypothetical protein AAGF67_14805 [Verrucomicrobiota bacterium]
MYLPNLQGQFHNPKTSSGQATINQQAVQQARMQANAASHSRVGAASSNTQAGAAYSGGDMILTDGKRQALSQWNPQISQMQGKYADVWGRAIHHSDGTFTESKQDNKTQTLEQITFSKNGTRLQRRMVNLDQAGRPAEVIIYDGREQFKYRGVLLYDVIGRFSEEQLYDPEGALIRRKVQEYTPQGLKLPLRSWDYVENVPADLQLVISDEPLPEERVGAKETPTRRGLFGQPKESSGNSTQSFQGGGAKEADSNENASEKRKGLGLGRLFGKKG